jgi:hypothetical protein
MAVRLERVHLRVFNQSELIFDETETKEILKFFFQADRQTIELCEITEGLRNFAQGLLVAAMDASFAMGWIEVTFRWVANPGAGLKKSMKKLAKAATKHWFKHLKAGQSLEDAKVYESIRDQLARSFRSPLQVILLGKAQGLRGLELTACINCAPPLHREKIWG